MPSLKALRTRINSVKSTQKITSAMKMVAASKLRRAQAQAEAARPYAERMQRMLSALAGSLADSPNAPALLAGTGKDQTHLLIAVTGDRGLAGAFNANIGRATRTLAVRLEAQGKTVKILAVGRKGRDYLRRDLASRFVGDINFVGKRRLEFSDAQEIGERVTAMVMSGEVDVCTLIYNRFHSVISQVVTEAQLIPPPITEDAGETDALGGATYDFEPDEETILSPPAAAERSDPGLSRAAGKQRRVLCLADDRHGQRDAQCRRHDQAPDAELQPRAAGQHHQGTDRDHLRRRSRLIPV